MLPGQKMNKITEIAKKTVFGLKRMSIIGKTWWFIIKSNLFIKVVDLFI